MNSNLFCVVVENKFGKTVRSWRAGFDSAKLTFDWYRQLYGATHAISIRAKGKRTPLENYCTAPTTWLAPGARRDKGTAI